MIRVVHALIYSVMNITREGDDDITHQLFESTWGNISQELPSLSVRNELSTS